MQNISVRQIKAARALLDWSQDNCADAAGISISTLKRLESKDGLLGGAEETAEKIIGALERAGVQFSGDGEIVLGVTAGLRKGRRARS